MVTKVLALIWVMLFGANANGAETAVAHYDTDEYWVLYTQLGDELQAMREAAIIDAALREFDAIYDSITIESQIIIRSNHYRQMIFRSNGRIVRSKMLGRADAFQLMEAIFNR